MATLTQQTIQQTRTLTLLLAAFLALGFNTLAQAHGDSDHVHPEQYSVLFVSAGHSNKAKVSRLKELLEQSGDKLGLKISQKAQADLGEPLEALNYFSRFDLVVLDAVSARSSKQAYGVYLPLLKQVDLGKTKLLAINWLSEKALTIGIDSADAKALHDYYDNGGRENLSRMLVFSSCKVLQQQDCQVPKAIEFPSIGFYHPDYEQLIFADRASFMAWRKAPADKPLIGLSMQRAMVESMETQLVDAAIKAIEAKGAIALPYYFEMSPRASNYLPLLQEQSEQGPRTVVDAIINLRSIHWADKRHAEFSRLGVPVLQGLQYYDGDQQTWEQDTQGISPMMTPFALVLPETAGVIDPTTIAAKDDISEQTQVIDYQLQYLVDKTLRHSQLKRKANRDKKLAVMVWGSSDVGASFLNVPDSLRAIAGRLNAEGYSIPAVEESYFTDQVDAILEPFYRAYELDTLLNNDQAELMPVDEYKAWFAKLPKPNRERITEHWGQPEDNFMVVERDGKQQFVIPRIRAGNMLVLRQPPRSDSADKEQGMYHKKTIPVNHYYLAAYYYVRKYFGSDAIIHLGTHGSQEYLPGKERALSVYDDGNLAVGDTPVFYPFIVDDVGEAMQTKRRGNATVLAHMTPPFAAAGLQGKLADIHELMHQYNSLDEGGVKVKTGKQIVATCLNEKLCEDMNWDQPKIDADFPAFLDALHEYMEDLAAQNQPLGLHSFGELPRQALQISTLLQMLGSEFLTPASEYEKKHYSGNIDLHQHDDGRSNVFSQIFTSEEDESLQNLAGFKLLRDWVVSPTAEAAAINALADPAARQQRWQSEFGEPLATLLSSARKHYANYAGIEELNNLVKGLQGEFIEVRNGGDPIRHPESLPTGFNLIGFDPSKVPTKAAWEQGAELTEQLIADYYKKHGRYPDKLAFSLWSIETMRHYGVLEAQAMRAMGVEPEWAPGGRVSGFKITPASELKRPRVDVVLSATGLYRDAFPNIMQRLAKSIEAVAKLKEEGNSLWKNSQRIAEQLKAEGMDAEEAEYLSSVRIFSNQSGNYGSGVNNSVFNPETWESDAKIADLYMGKMGYYFGADKDRWGKEATGLYAKQLSGTDVALFSRSSNVYGMLSSDDPFEYYGSLSLAIRNIDGKSPEMMISNLRDASNPKAEGADKFLFKELRTRQFHKRWIEEMQVEGYSGAVTLAGQLANFWGWQVVDPNLVRDDQWQEFYEVYVKDKHQLDLDKWFEEVNPKSQAQMLEWMLEANRKEYWQANPETLSTIIERYQELLNKYDLLVKNEKMREFIEQQAQGFGLDIALPAPEVAAQVIAPSQPSEQVEGQKLEEVQAQDNEFEWDWPLLGSLFACLLFFGAGALWQRRVVV